MPPTCASEDSAGPRAPRWTALHALAAGIDFDRYFRWRRAREGDPFYVRFPGFGAALFTGTAVGAREMFRAPVECTQPPRPNPIEPMVGAASLILASGERHRRDRALLTPAFHSVRIRAYGELIRDATVREMSGESGRAWVAGARVDARAAARALTLRVISTVVFGADNAQRRAEYTAAVTDFLTAFSGPLMLVPALRHGVLGHSPWDRFHAARARLDTLIRADIAHRRRSVGTQPTDVLGILLSDADVDAAASTDDELCDQVRTLLVAGHETTATALVWALFRLHRAPGPLARLRAELRDAGPDASPTELAGLPYLDAVCQETLRLHPPVPIVVRRLTESYTLRGVALAPGDTMGIAVPLLHSDPDTWSDARRFEPGRFIERRYRPFEFAPFGGGHRRCVGAALADYELRIALATILGQKHLRLAPRYARGHVPLSVPHNIATGPHRPIWFDVVSDVPH
ncbi:cytochrome P450 [Nocardia sp. NBC_00508]|uniref:cytochrome P450 n=1 Tax=Nocardia sp. NBC_00508 TaxID=2975992 RepID=UPI002E80A63A|nr:cytochrome P450 [Nocardia sp. NBC_00508]WUD69393.1 cytochrome P450 [Nocardia sp. NBC_00508]